ncbi:VPLPA-CTERM sorting domain-containing protein [Roseisalinus antarcticus]|uniref:Uncharacterized protein n=1 Tax=Roseisalinus antarcticus TaxID=254357 RepID=A0A1Y5SR66_9RHOB|nr:VPLPA-CTERM sorting domain-containing protein [Roseisalinus antarcticus]SLN46395.1 hypothetical protein ROA7023_01918 [Roseisalinus antarcticus]
MAPGNPARGFVTFTTATDVILSLTSFMSTQSGISTVAVFNGVQTFSAQPIDATVVPTTMISPGGSGDIATLTGGGQYTFLLQEYGNPSNGLATFSLAAVPLPAGLVLLLTGLGGLVLLRRKGVSAVASGDHGRGRPARHN